LPGSTQDLIKQGIERFTAELPALAKLKLVFELELQGRGDVQMYRVEVPGPKISKTIAEDATLRLSIQRADFNELAEKGTIKEYRASWDNGHIKVEGDEQIQKLLGQVIERHEERAHLRKAR
jgi:hypothetical protein